MYIVIPVSACQLKKKDLKMNSKKTTIEIRCDFSLFRDIVKKYNEYSRNILVRLLINIIKENLIDE